MRYVFAASRTLTFLNTPHRAYILTFSNIFQHSPQLPTQNLPPFYGVCNAPLPWVNLGVFHKLLFFPTPVFCTFFAFFFGAKFLFKKCKRTPRKPLVLQCFEVTFITGFVYKELIYKRRNKGNLFGNLFFTNKKRTIPQ